MDQESNSAPSIDMRNVAVKLQTSIGELHGTVALQETMLEKYQSIIEEQNEKIDSLKKELLKVSDASSAPLPGKLNSEDEAITW